MPNIYLRTSRYVAAFMRAVGDGQSLPLTTPVTFSSYTHEHVVLINGLRVVPEQQQHRASCYSQSAWNNMLRGRLPQGGLPILQRNPNDYLTYTEICALERLPNKTKTDAYEFLCIAIPREIALNGHIVRTNKSYALDTSAANQLRRLLRNTFVRTFLDFEQRNEIFARDAKIHRTSIEIMERFFMEYDLPVSHSKKEGDSMRVLAQRWRREAEALAKAPAIVQDDLITRIDDHELSGGKPKYD